MTTIRSLLKYEVSSEVFDLRFGEAVCFVTALIVLVLGFVGVGRVAETMSDVMLGSLATLGVSVQLVIMGIVLPLRRPRAIA